jgi:hypothetical protein
MDIVFEMGVFLVPEISSSILLMDAVFMAMQLRTVV